MKKELKAWKETDVKIGFIGRAGVGKSTQINKFRGLTDADWEKPHYARTGSIQTTTLVQGYNFDDGDHKRIILYDLPGSETPDFLRQDYAKKVNMDQFHAFIFLTSDRFCEGDIFILNEIKKRKKPYFFARTKMDEVAWNLGKRLVGNLAPSWDAKWKKEKEDIAKDCLKNLNDATVPIYLISREDSEFIGDGVTATFPDNQRLKEALIDQLPDLQKAAFLIATAPESKGLIERKVKQLTVRICKVAAISGSVAALPAPGLSTVTDIVLLEEERYVQRKTLGITAECLQKKAHFFGMNPDELVKRICDKSSRIEKKMIQSLLTSEITDSVLAASLKGAESLLLHGAKTAILVGITSLPDEALKIALPVLGNFAAAFLSASTTLGLLKTMLWIHALAAERFYDEIREEYLRRQT